MLSTKHDPLQNQPNAADELSLNEITEAGKSSSA